MSVVAVLGMHRSGTSCLTGCLQECGLQLGEVKTENWDNLKGNRENLELRNINDEILSFNGGNWRNPPTDLTWNADLQKMRDESIAARSGLGDWGFKDPRTILTLPFWLEALPDLKLVGTFRHPAAVANSLLTRNRTPKEETLGMWRIYNQRLLEYSQSLGVPLVCFDWPTAVYLEKVVDIAVELGLPAPNDEKAPQFFEEQLRRESSADLSDDVPADLSRLYDDLLSLCDQPLQRET